MTFSQFFSVMRLESRSALLWLGISVLNTCLPLLVSDHHRETFYSLGSVYSFTVGVSMFYFCMMGTQLFPAVKVVGSQRQNARLPEDYEFIFTRAISRRHIFIAKAALFLLFAATPLVLDLGWSLSKPDLRVNLPSDPANANDMAWFYQSQFNNVTIGTNQLNGHQNMDSVTIPWGQLHVKAAGFLLMTLAAMLFQLSIFTFWGRRFSQMGAYVLLLGAYGIFMHNMAHPLEGLSATDTLLGYAHHSFVIVAIFVAGFTASVQWFSCRRFVATEVTA